MHQKSIFMLLAIPPAIFAFFLVSVLAMAVSENFYIATFVGIGAALSSTAMILRH